MITGEPCEPFVQPIPCGCAGWLYIPGENALIFGVGTFFAPAYGRCDRDPSNDWALCRRFDKIKVFSNRLVFLWVSQVDLSLKSMHSGFGRPIVFIDSFYISWNIGGSRHQTMDKTILGLSGIRPSPISAKAGAWAHSRTKVIGSPLIVTIFVIIIPTTTNCDNYWESHVYQFLSLSRVSPNFSCISWGFIASGRSCLFWNRKVMI